MHSALIPGFGLSVLDCRATDSEIAGHAVFSAGRVRTMLAAIGQSIRPMNEPELMGTLTNIARACQARPAQCKTVQGTIARMTDAAWWTRNLRRELLRENETQEHAAGSIHKSAQVYVSHHAAKAKKKRRKACRDVLENLEVVNQDGEAFNLQEVADSSVSNPALRRAELMVRCRGFEEVAEFYDHRAVFLTLTCPSRFHRAYQNGAPNKKWAGATPKDAQQYLNKTWSKIRAQWKRAQAMPYGFRVAEPHHDGTPHWHILLFMPAQHVQGVIAIARQYACADSPTERGMSEHRFTAKMIDPSKGSATGYIAKYICKNIDGEKEGGGVLEYCEANAEHGEHLTEDRAAQLVRDWASTWGIRQFQQVGGPSVTVWRELRRMREPVAQQEFNFEGPRHAADLSMWGMYWILQGGPATPRANLTLKPAYMADSNGKYGEEVKRIWGVTGAGLHHLQTRVATWTVQRAGLAVVNEWCEAVKSRKRVDRVRVLMGEAPLGFSGLDVRELEPEFEGIALAWTGVNNCTGVEHGTDRIEEDFNRTGHDRRGGAVGQGPHAHQSDGRGLCHPPFSGPSGYQ